MPWKTSDLPAVRAAFLTALATQQESVEDVCARFGVTRMTAVRWRRRYAQLGAAGLADRRSGPAAPPRSTRRQKWEDALVYLRRKKPRWGPAKLRAELQRREPGARLPSVRTIARLLAGHGLVAQPRRYSPRGPALLPPPQTQARRCHTVWTVDFKGDLKTRDGQRHKVLTIRDLFSRYLLCLTPMSETTTDAVRRVMQRCFQRHGLPRVIRVDNGPPFGGWGALGLSRLSVWWSRLGIQVEFIRRGCPQDNGAHEQMHRVLQAEVATPAAASRTALVARLRRFQQDYNELRPHAALGQRRPADLWRPNRRRYRVPAPLYSPPGAQTVCLGSHGKIYWQGRQRRIGEAFAGELLWLREKPASTRQHGKIAEVFWGRQLIGELHASDLTDLRPAVWQPRP